MQRRAGPLVALALAGGFWAGALAAQDQEGPSPQTPAPQSPAPQTGFSTGIVQSAVLIVDFDRLFIESLYGKRVLAEERMARDDLGAENREIEAALMAEEQSLTERRPTMEVESFRAAAAAFDERVQEIRTAQDAKERALQNYTASARETFLTQVAPLIGAMMQEAGAAVILDRRSVFLALGSVDITDEAIAAIDAAVGDGAALGNVPSMPETAPIPGPELPPGPEADPESEAGTAP